MFWTSEDGTVVNILHIAAIRPDTDGIVTLYMSVQGLTIDITEESMESLKDFIKEH